MAIDPKEPKLTKEQKKKLFKLHLNSLIKLSLWGAGHGLLLGAMNIGITLFIQYAEIPESFLPVAAFLNVGFVLFSLYKVNRAERDRLNSEILKIISEDQNQ